MPPVSYSLFDLIELRSFSSLWYWVLVALTWARISQAPLGVPYDMVERARDSVQCGEDLLQITGLQVRRRRSHGARHGPFMAGVWAFVLSILIGLSFGYGSELAISVLLLAGPLALVQWMSQRAARDLAASGLDLDTVVARLRRLKRRTQAIALIAVFLTAVFGMYHNLATTVL